MTSFATRFRPFPASVGMPHAPDSPPASASDSAPTMDASMTPQQRDATVDASLGRLSPFDATLGGDVSRPTVVDPSMRSSTSLDAARYEVKSVLGRGGMGEVRLCHDVRVGRDVAIKVAHTPKGDDDGVRARFLRESRVQGQLEHPAIVPVYDLEIFEDGSAYFAMKRVRGLTLAAILAGLRAGDAELQKRFPQRKLLGAFNSICIAVDFAHTKGVVHRDIKPGNIMLGDFGEVYLLDWGLAKVVAHDDVDAPLADVAAPTGADETVAGSLLGTPGYMAPEQIDASIGPIAPAADIYALGAVLFELVARERYIDAPDFIEATIATLRGAERRPSRRAQPAVAATIAPALDDICALALARSPADRFASARALHDAIEAHLSGEQDLERRSALSLAHLAAAARQPETDAGRAAALKELGSALALDAENADARRLLVKLLMSTPSAVPPEVKERIRADERERIRSIGKLRATSGLSFLPFIPLSIVIGVLQPWLFAASFAAIAVTSLLSAYMWRSGTRSIGLQILAHALFIGATLGMARLAGPFMVMPGLLVAYAVELQNHPRGAERNGTLIACCLAVLLGFGIELSGLVAPSYSIVDGGIMIHSRMVALNDGALWLLALASIATIIAPSVFAARVRGQLAGAEAKLHLQAWQLAQIVPPETRATTPR